MNFCATHNQFYKDFCVYCGPPQSGTITDRHVCVSNRATVPQCITCGKQMIASSWPDVSVVTQECGGKSDAG